MKMACALLIRSLDLGKNAMRVQFKTVQQLRAHLPNYAHTTPMGMGPSFIADNGLMSSLTNATTNSMWFRGFAKGMHRHMGDVWIPDWACTIQEIKAMMTVLEGDWETSYAIKDYLGLKKAALTMVAVVAGFFGGLRGEEICKIDVGGLREH